MLDMNSRSQTLILVVSIAVILLVAFVVQAVT